MTGITPEKEEVMGTTPEDKPGMTLVLTWSLEKRMMHSAAQIRDLVVAAICANPDLVVGCYRRGENSLPIGFLRMEAAQVFSIPKPTREDPHVLEWKMFFQAQVTSEGPVPILVRLLLQLRLIGGMEDVQLVWRSGYHNKAEMREKSSTTLVLPTAHALIDLGVLLQDEPDTTAVLELCPSDREPPLGGPNCHHGKPGDHGAGSHA